MANRSADPDAARTTGGLGLRQATADNDLAFVDRLQVLRTAEALHLTAANDPPARDLVALQVRLRRAGHGLSRPGARWYVAVMRPDDRRVAAVLVDAAADELHVVDLVVDPGERRRGHGAAILDRLAVLAGNRPIRLHVGRDNHPALALYKAAGFAVREDRGASLLMERPPSVS